LDERLKSMQSSHQAPQFDVGQLSGPLLKSFEQEKETLLEYLTDWGEVFGDTEPLRLRIDAQASDAMVAAHDENMKHLIFEIVGEILLGIKIEMIQLEEEDLTPLKALTSKRVLVIVVDEDKGGCMAENIVFQDGEMHLLYTPFTMAWMHENTGCIGNEFLMNLPQAMREATDAGADLGPEVRAAQKQSYEDRIDRALESLAFYSESDKWDLKLEPSVEEMEAEITGGDAKKAGSLLEVVAYCLETLDKNITSHAKQFSQCVKWQTIEFRIGEQKRSHSGQLEMRLKKDRRRVAFVGPPECFTIAANSSIGKDFKEEYERVYDAALSSDSDDGSLGSSDNDSDDDDDHDSYGGGGDSSSSSVKKTCKQCKGAGHRTCNLCHGRGCRGNVGCKGTGKANAKCTSCRGTGMK